MNLISINQVEPLQLHIMENDLSKNNHLESSHDLTSKMLPTILKYAKFQHDLVDSVLGAARQAEKTVQVPHTSSNPCFASLLVYLY